MDGFLYGLYQLAGFKQRRPREDFVSLCTARLLRRDPAFAGALLARLADELPSDPSARVHAWLRQPAGERELRVEVQVPARAVDGGPDGAMDVVLRLGPPARLTVVLEAKVGLGVPTSAQLQKYAAATAHLDGVVVALVERAAAPKVPEGWPVLTWDDVIAAVPRGDQGVLGEDRRELLDLLAEAEVGDPRAALQDADWSIARGASRAIDAMSDAIAEALVGMFPTADLRAAVRDTLAREAWADEPALAWGLGFWRGAALPGTRLVGATLGAAPGDDRDELVWHLEVRPSNAQLVDRLAQDPTWRPLPRWEGWLFTELHRSRGDRELAREDMTAVVRAGRLALRDLHGLADHPWPRVRTVDGPAVPPGHGIRRLHAGLRKWSAVNGALYAVEREVLTEVCRDLGGARSSWVDGGLQTGRRLGRRQLVARVQPGDHFDGLVVTAVDGDDDARADMAAIVDAWNAAGVPGARLMMLDGPAAVLQLDEAHWRSPDVVTCLAEILRAGCGLLDG